MKLLAIFCCIVITSTFMDFGYCDAGSRTATGQNGTMYYFASDKDKMTWFDAYKLCIRMNMMLLEIRSPEEHFELLFTIHNENIKLAEYAWMGGTDDATEGIWLWISDLSEIVYVNWNKGEPERKVTENCMALARLDGSFKWNDLQCDDRRSYICYTPTTGDIMMDPLLNVSNVTVGVLVG